MIDKKILDIRIMNKRTEKIQMPMENGTDS